MARISLVVIALSVLGCFAWAESLENADVDGDIEDMVAAASDLVAASEADAVASELETAASESDGVAGEAEEAASDASDAAEAATPPLKIDPQLRRALLQALTRLEKEAEEEASRLRDQQEQRPADNLPPATEETPASPTLPPSGNFRNFASDTQQQNRGVNNKDPTTVSQLPFPDEPPSDSVSGGTVTPQRSSFDNINFSDGTNNGVATQLPQEARTESRFEILPENADIQSNIISTSSSNENSEVFKSEPQVFKSDSPSATDILKETLVGKNGQNPLFPGGNNQDTIDVNEKDVSIFQAPLVAAFTLHHDLDGLPKSVVPLFRPRPTAATPVRDVFQSDTKHGELQQGTIKLQQQLFSIQEQQIREQNLLKEQRMKEERQRQQQLLREQETKRQQLQEQQILLQQQELQRQQQIQQQQRFRFQQQQQQQRPQLSHTANSELLFPQQQPFFPIQPQTRLRSQRQESGTAIVDFQKSLSFPFIPPAATSIQPLSPPLQRNNFFNQPSFLNFRNNHGNQGFSTTQGNSQKFSPFPTFSLRPDFASVPSEFQTPPPVDKQLQTLLYQSGIARDLESNVHNGASPLEDLNILSKVLSLNHDPLESSSKSNSLRSSRTTFEGNHGQNIQNVQPPSFHLTAPHI